MFKIAEVRKEILISVLILFLILSFFSIANATYYPSGTGKVINATNMSWVGLHHYPAACPASSAITQLGDSVTCTDSWIDAAGDNITGTLNMSNNNITYVNRLSFNLGEYIDNLADGWIKITGSLNVTQNITAQNIATDTLSAWSANDFNITSNMSMFYPYTMHISNVAVNTINGWDDVINMTTNLTVWGNVTINTRLDVDNIAVNNIEPLDDTFINFAHNVSIEGNLSAGHYYSQDGTAGFTGTCASSTTITVKNGIITGCV